MQDFKHFKVLFKMLRLIHIAGNAIEHKDVNVGLVDAQHGLCVHVLSPHLDREFVRDKFAARGVRDELFAEVAPHIE